MTTTMNVLIVAAAAVAIASLLAAWLHRESAVVATLSGDVFSFPAPEHVESPLVAPDGVLWCSVYSDQSRTERLGVVEVNVAAAAVIWHEVGR
jgi:hypothetical protein